jgi:hypothetical protein
MNAQNNSEAKQSTFFKSAPCGNQPALPALTTGCESAISPAPWSFGPAWFRLWLGKTFLRACPQARDICADQSCRLRALCKCAQDDLHLASKVEIRVWAVLTVSAAAVLLYFMRFSR